MKKVLCLVAVIFLFISGATNAMNIFSSEFQKKWDELSKDISKLNEYTRTHPNIEMKDTKVEDIDIDGAMFNGATFENVVFTNVSSSKSRYLKVKFINCKFENYKAWNSEFVNVEFENCEFISTNFLGSKVVNVKIKNCTAIEAEFDDLTGDEIFVEKSVFKERSSFTDSKIPFVFRETTLDGVNMMGLDGANSLLIEGGLLDEVNFGKSHFSTVTLRRVKQGEGPVRFNGATADRIKIEDVDLWRGLSLAEMKAGFVSIEGGKLKTAFSDSVISKVYARDVDFYMFSLSEAHLPYVSLMDCQIRDFPMWDGFVEELFVQNSTIEEVDGENFKADTVVWDNVTLDGKIDLTNAHVEDFQVTRLKRGPKLQLITTGSNLKF